MEESHPDKKLCKGPLHPLGKLVHVEDFYKRWRTDRKRADGSFREGHWELHYICKPCQSHKDKTYRRSKKGVSELELVPRHRYDFAFEELVRKLGKAETVRRLGMSPTNFIPIHRKQRRRITRRTASRALMALAELRASGEVRHVDSIKHGSYLRGREEKTPQENNDFYSKQSDLESQQKRERRREESSDNL